MAERLLAFLQSQCKASFSVSESGATGPLRHFVILGKKKKSRVYLREPTTAGGGQASSTTRDDSRLTGRAREQGEAEEKVVGNKEKISQGDGAVDSIAGWFGKVATGKAPPLLNTLGGPM